MNEEEIDLIGLIDWILSGEEPKHDESEEQSFCE